MFILVTGFIGLNVNANPFNAIPLKCVSLNNQRCKVRPPIMNINSNEPLFYPCSVLLNKRSGSCNNNNDPYILNFVLLMLLKTSISKYLI